MGSAAKKTHQKMPYAFNRLQGVLVLVIVDAAIVSVGEGCGRKRSLHGGVPVVPV